MNEPELNRKLLVLARSRVPKVGESVGANVGVGASVSIGVGMGVRRGPTCKKKREQCMHLSLATMSNDTA